MPVTAFAVPLPEAGALLGGADFADGYEITVAEALDAPEATRRVFQRAPGWVEGLLRLRNLAVTPFGLKTGLDGAGWGLSGMPVISIAPQTVTVGIDDRHLDFRVVLTTEPVPGGTRVRVVSAIRTKNVFGRLYLSAVKPFHVVIVPSMLKGVRRSA